MSHSPLVWSGSFLIGSAGLGCLWISSAISPVLKSVGTDLQVVINNLKDTSYHLSVSAQDIHKITTALSDNNGLPRTLRNINILTVQAARISNEGRLASAKQRADLEALNKQAAEAVRLATVTITRADHNLNDEVLPALTDDLKEIKITLDTLAVDSHSLILASTKTIDDAGAILADTSITDTLKNMKVASTSLAHTAVEVDEGVGYIRDDLKPQKKAFWKSLLPVAISTAIGFLMHRIPQRVKQ